MTLVDIVAKLRSDDPPTGPDFAASLIEADPDFEIRERIEGLIRAFEDWNGHVGALELNMSERTAVADLIREALDPKEPR